MKNGLNFSSSRIFSPATKEKKATAPASNSRFLALEKKSGPPLIDIPTARPTSTLISSLCQSQLGGKNEEKKDKQDEIRPDIFRNQTASTGGEERPNPATQNKP